MQLALLLLELDGVRRNLDCQVHSCRVYRGVKVRSQHGGSDGTRLRTGNAALQLLFFRLPASMSAGFTLQYPLRQRATVPLRSTLTLSTWQLPSSEAAGVYPRM